MGLFSPVMAICAELEANTESPPDRTGYHNPRGSKNLSLLELAQMQRSLAADAVDPGLTAKERASCAIAWKQLEGQRLDTSGCPRPGQYRPELKRVNGKKSKSADTWHDPSPVAIEAVEVKQIAPVVASTPPEPSSSVTVPSKADTTSQQ